MALGGLTALGAVGEGIGGGIDNAKKLHELQQLKDYLQGRKAYGDSLPGVFQSQMPGAQPMPGGPPGGQAPGSGMQPPGGGMMPPGGQPPMQGGGQQPGMMSQPQRPPMQMGQPGGGQPGMPQQQPQPPGSGQQPQQGPLQWQQVVTAIKRNNPQISGAALAQAVDSYMPIMNQQSKLEWQEMKNQLMMQLGVMRQNTEGMKEGGRMDRSDTRAETQREATSSRERTAGAAETGRNTRAAAKETGLDKRFNARQDATVQKLEIARKDLERKVLADKSRAQIGNWRNLLDAEHKRALEVIQAHASTNNMPDAQRKALVDQQNKDYSEAILKMREQMGASTQTGGGTGEGPKQTDRMPATGPTKPNPSDGWSIQPVQ